MKLILATTPFLAKFAFSVPAFAPQNMVEELMLEELTQLDGSPSIDCPDVWNRVCSGTNSNGDGIYGSWTCGARVQFVHDYRLGRSPSLSAAIDQVLSECPTQCQELADNQCDDHAQANLKVPDCQEAFDRDCTNGWGTFTCGARVKYDNTEKQMNLIDAISNTNRQCGSQCREFQNGNCDTFISENVDEIVVPSLNEVSDDYETVASVQATTRPLGTCQEAYDRTCTEGWGSFTCGARVKHDHTEKRMNLNDAISNTNRQCPTECREFQNGSCDTFISATIDEIVVENGSGSN